MSMGSPVIPDTPAPPPSPRPPEPPANNNKLIVIGVVVVVVLGLAVAGSLIGRGSEPSTPVAEASAAAPAPASVVPTPPSPSTEPMTAADAAHQFALDVQAKAPRFSPSYGLVNPVDLKDGDQFAPLVAFDFGHTPNSFNEWQILQDVLANGDAAMLTQAGIHSYADGVNGTTLLLVVQVSDANEVPGPSAHDYLEPGVTKKDLALSPVSAATVPTSSLAPASSPAAQPSPTGNTFGPGTWIVGKDIEPGTYRAATPGQNCYWERESNFTGSLNSIASNGNSIGGPIVVTIDAKDAGFKSEGCGEWSDDINTPVTASQTTFGDGIFIVGVDISPGTYRVDARNGCYWQRMKSFDGGLNSIVANDNVKGSTIVQISPRDAGFESNQCGTWTAV
jgi:hypothetical protein